MSFKLPCPECTKTLKVRQEHAGKVVRCPYCKSKVAVPMEQAENEVTASGEPEPAADKAAETPAPSPIPWPSQAVWPPQNSPAGAKFEDSRPPDVTVAAPTASTTPLVVGSRGGGRPAKSRGDAARATTTGTDVSQPFCGLVAVAATTVFYLLIWPIQSSYFGELFTARGWVPYVIVFFTCWSGAVLVLKWRKIAKQRQSLLLDVLPNELSEEIDSRQVPKFRKHIESLPGRWRESLFVNRVYLALEHFHSRGSVQEVASVLSSQSDIDAGAVESSYTMVKVFIWAIPILGFIGTVLGIGIAVGGLAPTFAGAEDLDIIKDALGSMIGGLAMAFDTTLIALIISIVIMFLTSYLQKTEEDLLGSVDEYCNETLLRRLDDGQQAGPGNAREIKQAVAEALAEQDAQFQLWKQRLETIGKTLSEQVAAGWEEINNNLRQSHQEQAERLSQMAGSFAEAADRTCREIGRLQETQVRNLEEMNARLGDDLQSQQKRAEEQLAAVSEVGRELVSSLTESQQKLLERIASTTTLVEGQTALASVQESLVTNLKSLQDTETYRRTLGTLHDLKPVLERLGVEYRGEPDGQVRRRRRWWCLWLR